VGSISLSSEPAIFVHGVQITTSGRVMDILSQIPASDVKSVQIQRGPAAAFLDGKANGAIHIVTRGGADDSRRQ
jgi:outer membrane receptor protein involved in Fe transport